jgi:hypothetical protein
MKNYLGDHVNPANYNGALNFDNGAQGFKLLRYLHIKNGSETRKYAHKKPKH